MRMMGADSVDYHRSTVLGRSDDHPGQALAYYASRGETPLRWGGSGAQALGLVGNVTDAQYGAIYGPGGAVDPTTRTRLANTKRPGMELVVAAHKSVAELGVLGRAEDMHAILDAERDATLSYLETLTKERGGRRGRAAVATPTTGLVYASTRHATSRAGDPAPHDHVLVANVVEMADAKGGHKAADTALWREHVHAATMVGRMASAAVAIELGYAIRPDDGPSGRLGHWAIDGIPEAVLDVHSKRAGEITAAVKAKGYDTYQARQVAARDTRGAKTHRPIVDLLSHWQAELDEAGYSLGELLSSIQQAGAERDLRPERLNQSQVAEVVARVLAPDGLLATEKVFSRKYVVVAAAPALYGAHPAELDRVVNAVLADPEAIAL
ncbi:MAG TPA: MobF family relaxase, partial [Acidimicrobiales bacterium]|nr:MobF family relaxase [Acidimicrobiales bacterium]